jgi:hypothetical protein
MGENDTSTVDALEAPDGSWKYATDSSNSDSAPSGA